MGNLNRSMSKELEKEALKLTRVKSIAKAVRLATHTSYIKEKLSTEELTDIMETIEFLSGSSFNKVMDISEELNLLK